MQRGAVGIVEPVTRVKGQQFDFGPFGERSRFVEHKSATVHPGFDRHEGRLAFDLLPNKRLQPRALAG